MCGRYTLASPRPWELRERFGLPESLPITPRYNIAPGDTVLAVRNDREGSRRGELLRWGLVPAWSPRPDSGLKMINARVETVARSPAFARAFERSRCLIIADGFYEWQAGGASRSRPKRPVHITRHDASPFAFAGLWSLWRGPGHEPLRTCTILTTAANPVIAPLHDRMPVILAPEAESVWLDPGAPAAELMSILGGLPAEQTALRAVGPAVNDARYDGPECLADAPEPAPALF